MRGKEKFYSRALNLELRKIKVSIAENAKGAIARHINLQTLEYLIRYSNQIPTHNIRVVTRLIREFGGDAKLTAVARQINDSKLSEQLLEATGASEFRYDDTKQPFVYRNDKGEWEQERFGYKRDLQLSTLKHYKAYLKQSLTAAIFSAIIKEGDSRKGKNVVRHTNLFVLDFDHIEVETVKAIVNNDQHTILSFVSPSGDGLKVIVQADYDFGQVDDFGKDRSHRFCIEQIIEYFDNLLSEHNVKADVSGVDIVRLCFLPYDPDPYVNYGADTFCINTQKVVQRIEKRQKAIEASKEGEKYTFEEAIEKAKKKVEETYTFEKGQRHTYLAHLAIYANMLGIELKDLQGYVYENIIAEWDIHSNPWTPYEEYAEDFGTWRKRAAKHQEEPQPKELYKRVSDAKHLIPIEKGFIQGVKAPTGTGKTFGTFASPEQQKAPEYQGFVYDLLDKGFSQVVGTFPTVNLTEQTALDEDILLNYITGNVKEEARQHAINDKVFLANYDLITKYLPVERLSETALFVDEWDSVFKDKFKDDSKQTCQKLFDYMRAAKACYGLSATPPRFVEHLGLNIKLNELPIEPRNKAEITVKTYKGKRSHIALSELRACDMNAGLHMMFLDDGKGAKRIIKILKNEGLIPEGKRAIIINSKDRKDPNYEKLIKTGYFDDDVCLVITTRFLEQGTNILNENVVRLFYFDQDRYYPDPDRFVQACNRTRNKEILPVTLLIKNRKRRGGTLNPKTFVEERIEKAQKAINLFNAIKAYSEIDEPVSLTKSSYKHIQDKKLIRVNTITNQLEIDYLEIWRDLFDRWKKSLSTGDYIDVLSSENPNFSFIKDDEADEEKTPQLDELIEEDKEQEKEATATYTKLLCTYANTVMEATYHVCKDIGLEIQIKENFEFDKLNISEGAQDLINEYADVFEKTSYLPAFRFITMMKEGFSKMEIESVWRELAFDSLLTADLSEEKIQGRLAYWKGVKSKSEYKNEQIEKVSRQIENVRAEKAKLKAQAEDMPIFSDHRFKVFKTQYQALKMVETGRTKAGRETFTPSELLYFLNLKQFVRSIQKCKGRQLTPEQIEGYWEKARGNSYIDDSTKKAIDKHGMKVFKALFDYETARTGKEDVQVFYLPQARISAADFCRKYSVDISVLRATRQAKKQPVKPVNGDCEKERGSSEGMTKTDKYIIIYRGNTKTVTSYQTQDPTKGDYIPF